MAVANSLRCLLILTVGSIAAAAQIAQSQAIELPGEMPVFVPQTETSKFNVSTMGLRISSDFDDNALNSQQDHQADFVVFIQPHVGLRVSGARLDWAANYALGLSRNRNFSAYDSLSHVLDSGFQLRLTKKLRLVVHETFLSSANPFDQLQASESTTSTIARTVPTETATVTPAEVRTEQARGDIIYVLSAHSTAGVGGEFFGARYSLPSGALSSNQVLQNSNSAAGHGYYMRQVTRHQWTGLDYQMQKSIFNSGQSSSLVHSFTYSHTIAMSPAMTLSLFAGPELSVTRGIPGVFSPSSVSSAPQSVLQWSGGVTGRWSGKRTSARANLSRRINNGGLLGAAQLSTGSLEVSRQLGRQWIMKSLALRDHSKALVGPGTLSTVSAAAGVTRKLAPNLSFEFQYWRTHMSSNGSLPPSVLADHNRISMSLEYELRRPLGR